MRRLSILVALVATGLMLASATPSLAQGKEDLVIGMSQFPATMNPNIEAMAAKSFVLDMAHRPFTTFDTKWQLICMLCVELPTVENGLAKLVDLPADQIQAPKTAGTGVCTPVHDKGITLTYTIQPQATWGDGTPVTTDDVLFTWQVGQDERSGVTNLELYRRITKIDVKDKKTFTMHVNKLTFDYAGINDFLLLPAHIERANFAEPTEYKRRTAYDTDPTNPGLYFGPYRVTQFVPGSHIALEQNPTWWGAKPHFKRIVVRVIENTAALEANLLSGSIDYVAGELGFQFDEALAFQKRFGSRFDVIFKPGLVYEHIDLNLDNPILADKRVRQALLFGADREAISQQLFEGKQPVAHSFVSPLDWVATDDIPRYAHDPAKAGALLDAAGWKAGPDGIRVNATGERLTFELMTTAGNRTRELVEQVLQSQWRKVGIDIRIKNEPARVFFGQTVRERKYSAMAMFAWISSPENVPRSTLHSSEIPTAANNFAGQNDTGFKNALADELIDCIEVEFNREKRRALWQRIQALYAEELPVVPLYYRADPFVFPKWLTGVEPTGHQYSTTLWIENWKAR